MAKLSKQEVLEAIILYQDGLSLQKIAEYFGITRQAIWDLLKRRIELRPQKRYGKNNNFYRGGVSAEDKAQNMIKPAKVTIKYEPSNNFPLKIIDVKRIRFFIH